MSDGGNEGGGKGVIKREGATRQVRGRLTIEGGGAFYATEGTFGGEGGTAYGSTPVMGGRVGCDRRIEDTDDDAWGITGARGRTVGGSVEDSGRFCRGAKRRGFGGAGFGQPAK